MHGFSPHLRWSRPERLHRLVTDGQLRVGVRIQRALWTVLRQPLWSHVASRSETLCCQLRQDHHLQRFPGKQPRLSDPRPWRWAEVWWESIEWWHHTSVDQNPFPPPTPTATVAPVPTPTQSTAAPSTAPLNVDFLGLQLSSGDAEVGLYVTFALLLVSVLAIIAIVWHLQRTRKTLKRATLEWQREREWKRG